VDGLEPAVAFFDAVVVESLRLLVPFGHDFGGVQEMLDADGKLVRFAPQVVKVRSREKSHGEKIEIYADSVLISSFLVAPRAKNILIISSSETLESACSTFAYRD